MQEEPNGLNREQWQVEQTLSGLAPAKPGLDRDRLMYELGRRSASRAKTAWQSIAAIMTLVAVSVALLGRPETSGTTPDEMAAAADKTEPEDTVPTEVPQDRQPKPSRTIIAQEKVQQAAHYFQLRKTVLENGLAALPEEQAITRDEEAVPTAGVLLQRRDGENNFQSRF